LLRHILRRSRGNRPAVPLGSGIRENGNSRPRGGQVEIWTARLLDREIDKQGQVDTDNLISVSTTSVGGKAGLGE